MATAYEVDDPKFSAILDGVQGLTEDERRQLIEVSRKAKEFEIQEDNKMNKVFEGQLFKFTNIVKGWQYRWFVLNPEFGTLEYYMLDEVKRKPRGAVHLAGAVISPSDEDGQMFAVSAACGEVYKLRAHDARERQTWVTRLRAVAEYHTQSIAQRNPPLLPRDIRGEPATLPVDSRSRTTGSKTSSVTSKPVKPPRNKPRPPKNSAERWQTIPHRTIELPVTANDPSEAFSSLRDRLQRAGEEFRQLATSIETRGNGLSIKPNDPDLLILKATSASGVLSLEQCFHILQQHHQLQVNEASRPSRPTRISNGLPNRTVSPGTESLPTTTSSSPLSPLTMTSQSRGAAKTLPSGEVTDPDSGEEVDGEERRGLSYEEEESQRDALLTLMGQLHLGADLTKVFLPSYVAEKRSLLEVLSDLLSASDLLVSAANEHVAPEERIVLVLKWLLCSLRATKMMGAARKPLNPVLGETFHCSWRLPNTLASGDSDNLELTFVGEQVSHHPPVSAFYAECIQKKLAVESSIEFKANFMNMFVGIELIGQLHVHFLSMGESYVIGLPQLSVRSLLSRPHFELSGRATVSSTTSGYSAYLSFPAQSYYGGHVHAVTGEAKNASGEVLCRLQGNWDGEVDFQYPSNPSANGVFNVRSVAILRKRVRPLADQDEYESRRVWQLLHDSMRICNGGAVNAQVAWLEADAIKRSIEAKHRRTSAPNESRLFVNDSGSKRWLYKYRLEPPKQLS